MGLMHRLNVYLDFLEHINIFQDELHFSVVKVTLGFKLQTLSGAKYMKNIRKGHSGVCL